MIKVLLFLQGLSFGGLEKLVYDMVRFAISNRKDVKFFICCFDSLGHFAEKLASKGVKINFLPRKKGIDILYPLKLKSFIKREGIQVIHAHNSTAWFYGVWASILSKIPLVYTEHDRGFPSPLKIKCMHYLFGKYTHSVVAVSKAVKQNLERYEHIKQIKVIYNGIDPDVFRVPTPEEKIEKKKRLGVEGDSFILGNVGRMDKWKNQGILIEVLSELKDSYPNVKLILVGGGEEEVNLKRLAEKEGVKDRVIFLGRRDDVNEILKVFDIFVFPSLTEGLPLVLIEAMATGIPVISSPVGGIPELVSSGDSGILISPTSKNDIKNAIIHLIKDSKLRNDMGKKGRTIFEERFSLHQMVEDYIRVYNSVIKNKNRS